MSLDMIDLLNREARLSAPEANWRGFRIRRIELKNFGGYHGRTSVFDLRAKGAVFSGENGAGKSTAIDAMRLLFNKYPSFNSATNDPSKDRSIEAYYLGNYASVDGDNGPGRRHLRSFGNPRYFMGILIVFENQEGQVLTLARLLYMRGKGDFDWRYITAQTDISLDGTFPTWEAPGRMSKSLEAPNGQLWKTAESYFKAVYDHMGFLDHRDGENAMRLLEKGIGVKKLNSVTEFVRDFILPRGDFEKTVIDAIERIDGEQKSARELRLIRTKIDMLRLVQQRLTELEEKSGDTGGLQTRLARVSQGQHITQIAAHQHLRRHKAERLEILESRINGNRALTERDEEELRSIEETLASKDGSLVVVLQARINDLAKKIDGRRQRLERIVQAAERIGVLADTGTAAGWNTMMRGVERTLARSEEARITATALRVEGGRKEREAEAILQRLEGELDTLRRFGSSLRRELLEARLRLATALGIKSTDMPFLCELVQIRPGEEKWEGVANVVFRGVGREILVSPALYDDAKDLVNRGKWGAHVVVKSAEAIASVLREDDRGLLSSKLDILSAHPFADAAETMVRQTASHRCVSDAEFHGASGKAVTAAGTIQSGRRAEKNDSINISDRSNYILGWNVDERRAALEGQLAQARMTHNHARTENEQTDIGIRTHDARIQTARSIIGLDGCPVYEDIEFDSLEVLKTEAAMELARASTGEIDALHERHKALKSDIAHLTREREAFLSERGALQASIDGQVQSIARVQAELDDEVATNGRMRGTDWRVFKTILAEHPALSGVLTGNPVRSLVEQNVDKIDKAWSLVRHQIQRDIDALRAGVAAAENLVTGAVTDYLNRFPEDASKLERHLVGPDDRARQVREEWLETLRIMVEDDLPRHEERVRRNANAFTLKSIEEVMVAIRAYHDKVETLIQGMNRLSADHVFDPTQGSRARIRWHQSEMPEVRAFRSELDALIRNFQAMDAEAASDAAVKLMATLRITENIREKDARDKIVDLRNWLSFDVEELVAKDDGTLMQVRVYTVKDGLSGGQAERLTMLLLGAGICYAFGVHDPGRARPGLQALIIDEAFMHSSDGTAAASLDLLSAMGIQVIAATPESKLSTFPGHAETIFTVSNVNSQCMVQPVMIEQLSRTAQDHELGVPRPCDAPVRAPAVPARSAGS